MSLRCKQGDLALVVYDEPGCESNIGRAVEVRGPVATNPRLGVRCWLIRPAGSSRRWRVMHHLGRVLTQTVTWTSLIEHPDAWMLPIPPNASTDREEAGEPEEREREFVLTEACWVNQGGTN